jgi:hypothetical protein
MRYSACTERAPFSLAVMRSPSRTLGAPLGRFALLLGAYAALAVVLTYPLVRRISSAVPHDAGDPLLNATLLWWNAHTVPLTRAWWNGFAFWPSPATITFSDHRLGESLLASPLQWSGLTALTAYNVTLLLTFPLCAIAAHWLAYTLTTRHDVSVVAGLAYGFNPYRFAHIEHLELLAAFGMPAALAALHSYWSTRRRRWLVAFGVALLAQALSCSYYFVFFLVMLSLWIAWFARRRDLPAVGSIVATTALVFAALGPIAWTYWHVHRVHGFTRGLGEIVAMSADLTSLVTASPLMALWGWTAGLNGAERQLFPGATIVALAVAGALAAVRTAPPARAGNRLAARLLVVAAVCAGVAAAAALGGPWQIGIPFGPTLSIGAWFKPLSLAAAAAFAAVAASSWVRDAHGRRSTLAFYLLAAAVLFLCSFGPKPAFLGHQILYEPPYAWLMRFGVFSRAIRVPARFAMPAILALSTGAALGLALLTRERRSAVLIAGSIAAVVADAWVGRLPFVDPPPRPGIEVAGVSSFVELPLGDLYRDVAAMYRSTLVGVPTVNGYSGFEPEYYEALRVALDERDETVLDALASRGPLLIASDRRAAGAERRERWLRDSVRARLAGDAGGWSYFLVSPRRPWPEACGGESVAIADARDNDGPVSVADLSDRDPESYWMTPHPQRAGDALLIDLGRPVRPCSVQISLGDRVALFPRELSVATSIDGVTWETAFRGKTAGRAVLAALEHPREAPMKFPIANGAARYVRLSLETGHPSIRWIVTDVVVNAGSAE